MQKVRFTSLGRTVQSQLRVLVSWLVRSGGCVPGLLVLSVGKGTVSIKYIYTKNINLNAGEAADSGVIRIC